MCRQCVSSRPQRQQSEGDRGCAQPSTMPALRESGLSQARAPWHARSNQNQRPKPSKPQPVARKVPSASTQLLLSFACGKAPHGRCVGHRVQALQAQTGMGVQLKEEEEERREAKDEVGLKEASKEFVHAAIKGGHAPFSPACASSCHHDACARLLQDINGRGLPR